MPVDVNLPQAWSSSFSQTFFLQTSFPSQGKKRSGRGKGKKDGRKHGLGILILAA